MLRQPSVTRALYALSLALLLIPAGASAQDPKPKPPKRERNLISREELVLASEKFGDLYMAVRSLRPHFLTANNRGNRTLGIGEPTTPGGNRQLGSGGAMYKDPVAVVYLDGNKVGDLEYLKGLSTKFIGSVKYLGPSEAAMEFGLGHEGGAILVTMFKETP